MQLIDWRFACGIPASYGDLVLRHLPLCADVMQVAATAAGLLRYGSRTIPLR